MTSGIRSNNIGLDDIFALYASGAHPQATGIKVNGVDIATRYQPLPGTAAAATGIRSNGADLNTLFSATANTPLPIDGKTFTGANHLIAPNTGTAFISFGISGSTWTVKGSLNFGSTVLASGSVPAGATKVQYTWGAYTVPFGSDAGGTVSNGAVAPTALSSSPLAQYTTDSHGATGTFQRSYPFRIDFFNSSGGVISTTNVTLDATTDSSA